VTQDWRDERIAELERQLADRDERIAKLETQVERLLKRVDELEARLNRNSSNSSQPPSKDTPQQREERDKKEPTGNKRGGQPGHKPHQRTLLPPEKVSRIEDHYPQECSACGSRLTSIDDPEPFRHQVIELPPLEPEVSEHRLHAGECDECGHWTRAELPVGVPRSMFGPRLLALVGLLTGTFRMGRRSAQLLLADVLGIQVSLGALSESEERVSEAVAPAVDEAVDFVRTQAVKHVDATSWSQSGAARTLWTITTALVTVFRITLDGKMPTVKKLLGRVRGLLVSDRATAFGFWAMAQRQICWAHLLRKFAGFVERGGAGSQIARELRETAELMFHHWHRVRDGTMSRRQFRQWTLKVRERFEWLLERGVALDKRGFSGSCANILEHRDALWTFADRSGVEPTNNLAERDLRPFVLWRKTSGGSQSERGDRYAERIMTVTHTLRKQRRPVFEYLYHACARQLSHLPPPSLLPSGA
jgi:transposase